MTTVGTKSFINQIKKNADSALAQLEQAERLFKERERDWEIKYERLREKYNELYRKKGGTGEQPVPTPPPSQPTPEPQPPSGTDVINQLHWWHNKFRADAGRKPLILDAKISAWAQGHTQWMADNKKLSHHEGHVTFHTRARQSGLQYRSISENVAYRSSQDGVKGVMDAWYRSSGHRGNLLSSTKTHVGFGYVAQPTHYGQLTWWTAVFVQR